MVSMHDYYIGVWGSKAAQALCSSPCKRKSLIVKMFTSFIQHLHIRKYLRNARAYILSRVKMTIS